MSIESTSYGHWTVISPTPVKVDRFWRLSVQCICGKQRLVLVDHLRRGKSKSCGCRSGTHGLTHSPTYHTWDSMKQRCLNPNNDRYKDYGGRGIKVCKRWMDSFEAFMEDMGERPKGTSIDRIDCDGDYTLENCRWATPKEQQNNRRIGVVFNGNKKSVLNHAMDCGITYGVVQTRLQRGWAVDAALTWPSVKGKKHTLLEKSTAFQCS